MTVFRSDAWQRRKRNSLRDWKGNRVFRFYHNDNGPDKTTTRRERVNEKLVRAKADDVMRFGPWSHTAHGHEAAAYAHGPLKWLPHGLQARRLVKQTKTNSPWSTVVVSPFPRWIFSPAQRSNLPQIEHSPPPQDSQQRMYRS